jgi:cell division protein FtsB
MDNADVKDTQDKTFEVSDAWAASVEEALATYAGVAPWAGGVLRDEVLRLRKVNEAAKKQLALYARHNGELAQWVEELKAEVSALKAEMVRVRTDSMEKL